MHYHSIYATIGKGKVTFLTPVYGGSHYGQSAGVRMQVLRPRFTDCRATRQGRHRRCKFTNRNQL